MKMNVADVIAPEYLNLARDDRAQSVGKVSTVYEIDIISKQGRRIRLEVSTGSSSAKKVGPSACKASRVT